MFQNIHRCCFMFAASLVTVSDGRGRGVTQKNGGLTNQPLQAAVIFHPIWNHFSNLTLIRPLKTMTSLDHWIHTYKIHGMFYWNLQTSPASNALRSVSTPSQSGRSKWPNGRSPNVEGPLHPKRLTAGTPGRGKSSEPNHHFSGC